MGELRATFRSDSVSLYRYETGGNCETYVISTPETRSICNDITVAGIQYTSFLQRACAAVLKAYGAVCSEDEGVVVNILRGGLNYGLRDALAAAYGWNRHTTCFISAQRARNNADSEEWHITENSYQKIYFPSHCSLFIGDVVATGTSLKYALSELVAAARKAKANIENLVFFTFGGPKAGEILEEVDAGCRACFHGYKKTVLFYIEGCFEVPMPDTQLTIRLTGTDLVRLNSVMAPDFIESQYENPAYPIERCTIYDAGSRAFYVHDYAEDVRRYWLQVLELAERGISYEDYLKERMPILDVSRFGGQSLIQIAKQQVEKVCQLIGK